MEFRHYLEELSETVEIQPNGFVLITTYYNKDLSNTSRQFYLDKNEKCQGLCLGWYKRGNLCWQYNRKDGEVHGKYQAWNKDGIRKNIYSNHYKKQVHGTEITFKYENK